MHGLRAHGLVRVPHELYPPGYHCDPKQPLPFIGIASQKNFIALYHMGIYADPDLLAWFPGRHDRSNPAEAGHGQHVSGIDKSRSICRSA